MASLRDHAGRLSARRISGLTEKRRVATRRCARATRSYSARPGHTEMLPKRPRPVREPFTLDRLEDDPINRKCMRACRRQRGSNAHLGSVNGIWKEVDRQSGRHFVQRRQFDCLNPTGLIDGVANSLCDLREYTHRGFAGRPTN